jgi:hypothetical protein
MVPLMAIWRNFFLGSEPTKGRGPLKRFDATTAKRITRKGWPTWASTSATPISRSGRSRVASASR